MRSALALAALLTASPSWADDITVAARVAAATVFPDGATVTRTAKFSAPAGQHTLLLSGVPTGFDTDSLRASGSGNGAFSIISIEQRTADPTAIQAKERSEAQKIEMAIERLEDQKAGAQAQIAAAERQIAFIDATIDAASVRGNKDTAAPSAQDWVTLWQQSNTSTAQALAQKQRATVAIRTLDRQIEQLAAKRPGRGQRRVPALIAVEIEADAPVDGSIDVKHFTHQAAWGPTYDARLSTEEDGSLTLIRRAEIQQRTGEPWRDVTLTLSTARPTGGVSAPHPHQRYAGLQPQQPLGGVGYGQARAYAMPAPAPVAMEMMAAPVVMMDTQSAPVQAKTINAAPRTQGEALVYDIPSKATIPGSGVVRQVLIGEESFDTTVELRATPSRDKTAYQYARFANTDGLILPGSVSLTRDGLYIGKGRLPMIAAGEKGAVAFGPLETVKIGYRVVASKSDDSFTAAEQTERRRYVMSVENISDRPRRVILLDAAPTSDTDEITVTIIAAPEPTQENAEDITGRLLWQLDVKPGQKTEVNYGFDVAYPLGAI